MAAGLLLQSLLNIYRVDTGFNMENLLVFRLNPAQAGYRDQELVGYYERVRQVIGNLPGVRSVSLSSLTLLRGSYASWGIEIDGRPPDQHLQAAQLVVNDRFFPDMGISLLSGRDFMPSDRQGSARVAVVNEAFSQSFFPDERCLGKAFRVGGTEYQIVGLCSDAKYNDVRRDVPPIMYFPYRQASPQRMTFAVRSVLPAMSLVPAVRRLITNIDQNIPMEEVSTQKQVVKDAVMAERLFAGLCGTLALLALALSCIGLYGLMAYSVARRTGELGIRMALGARPQDVARPVLREALILAAIGVAIGMPAALALTRLARSIFFGIEPHDPVTVLGSIIVLLAVAILAAYLPARRAAKIDPMEALRYE
jgi:predicted permease